MATIEFLRAEIERIGLSHLAPHILSHARPCIDMSLKIAGQWDISTDTVTDKTPIGTSKFGGHPDVPSDFKWPYVEETALPFLAQIRLDEIASFDVENVLPHEGLLLFFFDTTHEIRWETSIYHVEELTGIKRAYPPDALPEYGISEPHALSFSNGWSLPAPQSLEMEGIFKEQGSPFQATLYDEIDDYGNWYFKVVPHHRLFGHAFYQHHDTRPLAASINEGKEYGNGASLNQREQWREEAKDWRLFIQFGSEFDVEGAVFDIQWGNRNCIHLLIRDSDLKARNFSRVYEVS